MKGSAIVILVTAVVAGWARLAQAGSADFVTLDAKALQAAQLRLETLQPSSRAPQIAAYGVVLDPARLAALYAELAAKRGRLAADDAKMNLEAAEAARATILYRAGQNVALADLQKAQSQLAIAKADQVIAAAAIAQLHARSRAAWGSALAAAINAKADPLPAVEAGNELLVRVSLPLGKRFSDPPRMASATAPDGTHVALRFVGRSPRAAKRIAGQSSFYLMDRTSSAPIGTPLAVLLDTGPPENGVVVPRSAVVWSGGNAYVYRQTAPSTFAAVPIGTAQPTDDGYFVPEQVLPPAAKIVTAGAELLLSAAQSAKSPEPAKSDDED